MNINRVLIPVIFLAGLAAGCSSKPAPSADVEGSVRTALASRGLKDVSVSQDRGKGVVTLSGKVPSDVDKTQAASVAQSIAPGQVIANEIAIIPAGMESEAREIHEALDEGINSNMKALLVGKRFAENVTYEVRSRVVTLSGTVSSQAEREEVGKAAAAVPNVNQVVNELQVTNQRATSQKP